jgi:hypothetical protein
VFIHAPRGNLKHDNEVIELISKTLKGYRELKRQGEGTNIRKVYSAFAL